MKGKVKWFDNKKGYGFLTADEHDDIFVHYSQVEGEGFKRLDDGQEVEFEIADTDKGKQATNVVRI